MSAADLTKALAASDGDNVKDRVAAVVESLAAQFGWPVEVQITVAVHMMILVRDSLAEAHDSSLALIRQTFADWEKGL